jgi:stress-induced-phosphoprotein 1
MSTAAEFKAKGNAHLQAGEFDDAITAYTEAISIDPKDHVFFSNRSAAYLSKGDAASALGDGNRCTELNPTWPKGFTRKGAALHALKRYDEAVDAYKAGLAIAPNDPGLKSGLEEVEKIKASMEANANPMGGANGLFGPQMLAKLVGHPKFGPKLADPDFMAKIKMMQTNPNAMLQDPEMMEVLQVILGDLGAAADAGNSSAPTPPAPSSSAGTKRPAAAPDYTNLSPEERAKKEARDASVACKDVGNGFYKEKKFVEALAAYDEALEKDPSNLMVNNNKAAVYVEMGDSEKAIEICNDILDKATSVKLPFEERAKVYQRIAGARLKAGDVSAAIASYKSAQMENFDKNVERKIKNLELEQRKKAIQDYIDPEKGLEAKERGNTFFREGDFPKAVQEYEDAIKRDPSNAAYNNNLAAAFLKMGLFNDAKRAVDKSLELDPQYVKAWAKKGDIEFFMKEYHKAMDSYNAGMKIEPGNVTCKQGLLKVQMKIQEQNMNMNEEEQKERSAHAMADPEIQAILTDPAVRQVLTDFQENPTYAQQAMRDPSIKAKIEKLIAAGVLQVK